MEVVDYRGERAQLLQCFERLLPYRGKTITIETVNPTICREEDHFVHLLSVSERHTLTAQLDEVNLGQSQQEAAPPSLTVSTPDGRKYVLPILDEFPWDMGERRFRCVLPTITAVRCRGQTLLTVTIEDIGLYHARWHDPLDEAIRTFTQAVGQRVSVTIVADKTTYEDDEGGHRFALEPKRVSLLLKNVSQLAEGLAFLEGTELDQQQEVRIPFRGQASVIVTYGRYGFDLDSLIKTIEDDHGRILWEAGATPVVSRYLGFRDENLKQEFDYSPAGQRYADNPYLLIIERQGSAEG